MIELIDIRGNLIEPGDKLIRPIGGVHLMETRLIRYTPKGYYFSRPKVIEDKTGLLGNYNQFRDADSQTEEYYINNKRIHKDCFLIIEKK